MVQICTHTASAVCHTHPSDIAVQNASETEKDSTEQTNIVLSSDHGTALWYSYAQANEVEESDIVKTNVDQALFVPKIWCACPASGRPTA